MISARDLNLLIYKDIMHKQILKSKNGPAPGNAKTILSFCNMEALEPRKDYNEMNEVTSV